jgi:hypothetical protein
MLFVPTRNDSRILDGGHKSVAHPTFVAFVIIHTLRVTGYVIPSPPLCVCQVVAFKYIWIEPA